MNMKKKEDTQKQKKRETDKRMRQTPDMRSPRNMSANDPTRRFFMSDDGSELSKEWHESYRAAREMVKGGGVVVPHSGKSAGLCEGRDDTFFPPAGRPAARARE